MLMAVLLGLHIPTSCFAQSSTYWYVDGLPNIWYYQPDMFAFKCYNGTAFTGTSDSTIIDSIVHHIERQDKAVEVYFKPTATPAEILAQMQSMWNSGQIEMPYLTLTQNPSVPNDAEQWYTIDNILLVNFVDPYPNATDLANFMIALGLTPYSTPDAALPTLTQGPSYTYAFTIDVVTDPVGSSYPAEYFAQIARQAFSNFSGFVANAEPNIVNNRVAHRPSNVLSTGSITNTTLSTCPTNDPEFGVLNHIDNTGTASNIPYNSTSFPLANGVAGADAHICDCWSQGLSGSGIKVGVIGYSYLYFNTNPDMDNRYDATRLWDCTTGLCNAAYTAWNANTTSALGFGSTHGIAQIIGANGNDNFGTVGVAPEVNLRVYEIGNGGGGSYQSTFSTVAATSALQQALGDYDDIVVMDWFFPNQFPSINAEIGHLYSQGRYGKGTVLIAPAGHDEYDSVGLSIPMYPAAMNGGGHNPDVIGVIASNRFDQRCDREDNLATGGPYTCATNYGSIYEIAAPGPALPYAFKYPSSPGYAYLTYDEYPETGALGTVAGVAAMILEKDTTLTQNLVRNAIIFGADQVGGYSYANGPSVEMGMGRINCGNSINYIIGSSIKNQDEWGLNVKYTENTWLLTAKTSSSTNRKLILSDILGNQIAVYPFEGNSIEVPFAALAKGVYLLTIDYNNAQANQSVKVVHY